ncbi:MAG: microcystin degradation protein MlrC [Anaerolineaceae bacterium]|nr:microcystin degradation protein MlrC [Anaerolineaceae bacterium]
MRIAMGGIMIECCTFSPLLTQLDYFRILRGDEMLPNYPFLANFPGHEFLPTLHARSIPGGSVDREAYETIKAEFVERLRAVGPVDGLFLHMHGAMNVDGMDDAEGDWMTAAREVVGPDCLMSASFDLHGNISRRIIDTLDMLTTYRTAPHVDYMETQERAMRMLVDSLEQGQKPEMVWIPVPVALPGEKTSTEWDPGMGLYAMLPDVDAVPGVIDASMFVGYAWADEPRAHATIVITGTDRAIIEREAKKLAQAYWDKRAEFQFGSRVGSIDECIDWALAAPEKSVFISDSGDNPTAGGCDDVPTFVERLLVKQVPDAIVASIADAAAVAACYEAGVGGEVSVSLGGKLDTVHAQPLPVRGIVRFLDTAPEATQRQAVLQIDGVQVILTERRTPFHYIRDFQRLGLEPVEHKIVVVKIGYLEPDLKAAAPLALMALSPGAVDQAIERLPYERIVRPIYPLDPGMTWEPVVNPTQPGL